jgi:hypothetical protein
MWDLNIKIWEKKRKQVREKDLCTDCSGGVDGQIHEFWSGGGRLVGVWRERDHEIHHQQQREEKKPNRNPLHHLWLYCC